MYKTLRHTRIVVSVLLFAMLALCIVDAAIGDSSLGRWLCSMQFGVAVLAGSAVWIVFWVLVALLVGRVYCSTVCPLGTLQDVFAHLGRKFGRGASARYHYTSPFNSLRFPIPVVVAVCLFAGFTSVLVYTDPYQWFARIVRAAARPASVAFGSFAAAGAFLTAIVFISWKMGRLACNTVCPVGGLLGLLSRSPIYRIDINTDKCIHCGKCEDVCKSQCVNLGNCTVDNSRCVMCMNCTAVCPNDAITLRKGRYRLSTPMMQPTMQTTSPHKNQPK